MFGVRFPGTRENPQRLVDLQELALQLLLEQFRLVRHAGFDPGLRLGPLRVDGAERAEPGQCDQRHGGGDDAEQSGDLAAAPQVHRSATYGAARVLLKVRHQAAGWSGGTIRRRKRCITFS